MSTHLSARALVEARLIALVFAMREREIGLYWAPYRDAYEYLKTGELQMGDSPESLALGLAGRVRCELGARLELEPKLLRAVDGCEEVAS